MLYQTDATEGELRSIAYESQQLFDVQNGMRRTSASCWLRCTYSKCGEWVRGSAVTVRTSRAALESFSTELRLSQRQAPLSIAMQEHSGTSQYERGRMNVVADALSRRPDFQSATATFDIRKRGWQIYRAAPT